jgi:hypothetical protein
MAHIAPLVVVLGFLAERRDERRHADHDQTTPRPASPRPDHHVRLLAIEGDASRGTERRADNFPAIKLGTASDD